MRVRLHRIAEKRSRGFRRKSPATVRRNPTQLDQSKANQELKKIHRVALALLIFRLRVCVGFSLQRKSLAAFL